MNAKHRPGPWHYEQKLNGGGMPIPYSWEVSASVEPPPGNGIDEAFVWIADTSTEANARLIAAAPELLEALTALLDSGQRTNAAFYGAGTRKALAAAFDGQKALLQQARAAIAKATGGDHA